MIFVDVDAAVVVPVNLVPLIDDTDFKTRETAIAYNAAGMDLVWNFVTSAGVVTQTAVVPTTGGVYDWTHVGDGMYTLEIPASGGASINNDTEGYGYFTGICTGVLAWRGPTICFRASGLNDKLCDSAYDANRGLSGTALPAAAAEAAGGLYTRGTGAGQINQDGNGRVDVNAVRVAGTAQTAGDLVALINAIDDFLDTEIADIRNRLPAALTADGNMKSDVLRVGGTLQTAGDLVALLNAIDDFIDTEVAAIKAKTDNLPTDPADASDIASSFSSVLSALTIIDDFLDTEIAAIKAKTDNLPADPADASDVAGAISTAQTAILAKVLKYVQLMVRKDAAIATDNATEVTAINASGGSGAGAFANTTDALEAIRDALTASGSASHVVEGTVFRAGTTYFWSAALRVNGDVAASGTLSAPVLVRVRGNGNSDLGAVEVTAAVVGTDGLIHGSFTLTTTPAAGKPIVVVVSITYDGTAYIGHLRGARVA